MYVGTCLQNVTRPGNCTKLAQNTLNHNMLNILGCICNNYLLSVTCKNLHIRATNSTKCCCLGDNPFKSTLSLFDKILIT